ncbi:hypothetical protein COCOBI_03-5550 [Coccomyxa sp. Obi]|nr:hypothetical protein COCOBI_03-5550 [Coccomyxa sp. Obi]
MQLDGLNSNEVLSTGSQDCLDGVTAASAQPATTDPYEFLGMHADISADMQSQDSRGAEDSSRRENGSGIASQNQGTLGRPHSAGSHPSANGDRYSPLKGSQHDPSFLQRLIAAQRERNSTWSSEDSSSSDEEAIGGQKACQVSRPKNHRNRQAVNRQPESSQSSDGKRRDPAVSSKGSLDRPSAAPQDVPQSSRGSASLPSAAALKPPAVPRAPAVGAPSGSLSMGPAQEAARKRKEASQDMEMDIRVQPNTRPRLKASGTLVALGNSLLSNFARHKSQELDLETAPATSVMEAQESGEQFEIQDNVVYALDGLTSSASPAVRRESAAKIAEICTSRRGRLALRADALIQDVMAAGSKLALAKEPIVALAFSAMLLAFSRDKLDQAVLAQRESLTVLGVLLEAHANADFKACQARSACGSLARLLRDSPLAALVPLSERACPSSLALAALAGATDPQHSSTASEALKGALHEGGILQRLANVAKHHATALANPTNRSAARSLWALNRCLVAIENATFACAANEQHLVAVSMEHDDEAEPLPAPAQSDKTRSASQPVVASSEVDSAALTKRSSSQPTFNSAPPHKRFARMGCSEPEHHAGPAHENTSARHQSGASLEGSQSMQPEARSSAGNNACQQPLTFPAWLVRQAQVLAPVEKGVPGRGPYRDALQCMLSVLMNLTHNNAPGCAAILWANGLQTVICLIDAVLGPPEEEAIFVRIADRRRLLEGLDLTSTALGLLINLVEHDAGCRPHLAAIPLRHGSRALPLLCRLMQASGCVVEEPSAGVGGSPGLEVTEEQLLANEEEGAASIVEVYAALVLGFMIEDDPALRQEVECLLEGGVATVSMAVERCLQFYVNAGAITRSTEESLRALLASLQEK